LIKTKTIQTMKYWLPYLFCIFFMLPFIYTSAQCGAGEMEVYLYIGVDQYGYEGYWEIVPSGNNCGAGTIASGGNNAVGCNGAGDQNQIPGGYGNNQTVTEGPFCLTEGNNYTLYYIDDWGDGGFNFQISVNGFITTEITGTGEGGSYSFTVAEPPAYDLALTNLEMPIYQAIGDVPIQGTVLNKGQETINSLVVNYQINTEPVVSDQITGLSIANNETYAFEHPTPWMAASAGIYDVRVWVSNPNGMADENNNNDEKMAEVEIGPGIPNIIDDYIGVTPNSEQILSASNQLDRPTDLDFHPILPRKELWVINKKTENTGGATVTVYNAGESNQTHEYKKDQNSWHFMSLPTGIAFSDNGNFANSPGVFDANHGQGGGTPFTGPALWSSDMSIYAEPSGGNGSHLDMLHESPYCQGIAHEAGNAFWVFDGYSNDIVLYDFNEDHGPGNDDHSDGEIYRYSEEPVAKDPSNKVVSHLVKDKASDWLYVVDYGNQRVIRINTSTGTLGGTPGFGPFEPLAAYNHVVGYTWETVVSTGLVEPAGIDIIEDRLLVSDYATGEIIIYDISSMPAVELGRFDTGASGIMGIKIGPEGHIWYVDYDANAVYKTNLEGVSIRETKEELVASIFPNPNTGQNIYIRLQEVSDYEVGITDISGRELGRYQFNAVSGIEWPLGLDNGAYLVEIIDLKNGRATTQKLTVAAR
jgi:hypothetical protein